MDIKIRMRESGDAIYFWRWAAYLDLDLASSTCLVTHRTVPPPLNEVPRPHTARELEVCYCRTVVCPT